MSVRKVIFWLHLAAGLLAGSVILVMAVTGLLMSFEKQLIALAERDYLVMPVGDRLAPELLLEKVRVAVPDARLAGLTLRRDPAAAATVSAGRERTLFVNPYTGAILGEGSRLRGFLHEVEHFHRELALGENGKRITGAACLTFFALVLTGLYLWFPCHWAKAILRPKLGLCGKARDFNWHNSLGFWAALPLLALTLTGIIINYEWANRLLFRAAGSEPPPPKKSAAARTGRPEGAASRLDFSKLDELWALAEAEVPNWQSISLRAQNPNAPANLLIDWGNGVRPDQRVLLTTDLRTGAVTKTETFASYSRGRQLRMWVKPIHTGEAGGLAGQAVAALATASAGVLIWTGFALSWRRFFSRRKGAVTAIPAPLEAPAEPELANC